MYLHLELPDLEQTLRSTFQRTSSTVRLLLLNRLFMPHAKKHYEGSNRIHQLDKQQTRKSNV